MLMYVLSGMGISNDALAIIQTPLTFKVDRPFIFLINTCLKNLTLFIGKLAKP